MDHVLFIPGRGDDPLAGTQPLSDWMAEQEAPNHPAAVRGFIAYLNAVAPQVFVTAAEHWLAQWDQLAERPELLSVEALFQSLVLAVPALEMHLQNYVQIYHHLYHGAPITVLEEVVRQAIGWLRIALADGTAGADDLQAVEYIVDWLPDSLNKRDFGAWLGELREDWWGEEDAETEEQVYCSSCRQMVKADAANRASLDDHGCCVDCQIAWQHQHSESAGEEGARDG